MSMNDGNSEGQAKVLGRPILVPLDGSEVAAGILPYASQVAKSCNVPLVLLTVVDPDAVGRPTSAYTLQSLARDKGPNYWEEIERTLQVRALDSLRGVASRLRGEGVAVEIQAALGRPADQILQVSEEEGCGLIAMSTHGRNPISRSILGSVTDKVIHTSKVPVLTVTPERNKSYQEEGETVTTVVVPLDGSELAEGALPYAEELARTLSLEILLARAVRTDLPTYTATEFSAWEPNLTEGMLEEATAYLAGVAESLTSTGLTVRSQVVRGAPAQALLNLAQETEKNLIAMTTRGRSGLSRWLMGSVAEALVRSSGDPVLVIPS